MKRSHDDDDEDSFIALSSPEITSFSVKKITSSEWTGGYKLHEKTQAMRRDSSERTRRQHKVASLSFMFSSRDWGPMDQMLPRRIHILSDERLLCDVSLELLCSKKCSSKTRSNNVHTGFKENCGTSFWLPLLYSFSSCSCSSCSPPVQFECSLILFIIIFLWLVSLACYSLVDVAETARHRVPSWSTTNWEKQWWSRCFST